MESRMDLQTEHISALFPVIWNEVSALWYEITLSGLLGGQAGQDIDRNRANASVLMGRILYSLGERLEFVVSELEGGTDDSMIPVQSRMLIGIAEEDAALLNSCILELQEDLSGEYRGSDDGLCITLKEAGAAAWPAVSPMDLQKICFYLMQLPDGVQKMSGEIPGQVETSCNLGVMNLLPDGLHCISSVRSSIGSAKRALADKLIYLAEFLGGEVEIGE